MARTVIRFGKELLIAMILLGFGLFGLPMLVYWVGVRVVGEYGAEGGVNTLTNQVWTGLAEGNVFAWLLVTSPCIIIQLLRFGRAVWRTRPNVTDVTVSDINQ